MKLLLLPVMVIGAVLALYLLIGGSDEGSSATTSPAPTAATVPGTYQGKTALWWSRRAVQARKDANARGRTIRRLQAAQRRASAHFFDWLAAADCVHSHEGSWTDRGDPYWGGMQMDVSFQRAYGPDHMRRWGLASNWPWWAQLEAAYRGWLFRGWQPWPATSERCGLR